MGKENKKRVAIALWRINTPLKDIRTQTKIPERRPLGSDITLIKWPGNSTDLNPIENMWIWIKNKLKESSRCTKLQELRQEILKLWAEKMDDIQYLVDSMSRCLQDVIERDGGCTKYLIVLNYTENNF